MLCVIAKIKKRASDHSYSDHRKQSNNVIKTIFYGLSEYEFDFTLELYWNEYTDFYKKNGFFGGDAFIWNNKDISDGNSNFRHQKYSIICTKVLSFVEIIVTLKVLGIGEDENYWGDVKTIEYGKYLLSYLIYQRNRLLYIHLPVLNQLELNTIIMKKYINNHYSSHTWNGYDDDFDQQLKKWGVEKVFQMN